MTFVLECACTRNCTIISNLAEAAFKFFSQIQTCVAKTISKIYLIPHKSK